MEWNGEIDGLHVVRSSSSECILIQRRSRRDIIIKKERKAKERKKEKASAWRKVAFRNYDRDSFSKSHLNLSTLDLF